LVIADPASRSIVPSGLTPIDADRRSGTCFTSTIALTLTRVIVAHRRRAAGWCATSLQILCRIPA
jgi:hypothetical protein